MVEREMTRWTSREAWLPTGKLRRRKQLGVYHIFTASTASGCEQQEAWSSKGGNMLMIRA